MALQDDLNRLFNKGFIEGTNFIPTPSQFHLFKPGNSHGYEKTPSEPTLAKRKYVKSEVINHKLLKPGVSSVEDEKKD